jgi:hypothetical protein
LITFLPLALSAQIATTGVAKGTGVTVSNAKNGISNLITDVLNDDRFNVFEVNEEMFKAFCELENADSSSVALFRKIKSVQMIEYQLTPEELKKLEKKNTEPPVVDSWFYQEVLDNLDITGYNQLLKTRTKHTLTLLLKKELAPADNEFLLITDKMVIDIRGDIKIKTIYEMEEMMGQVQQILPN